MRKSTEGQPLIFVTAQEQEFDASMPSSNGLSKSLTDVVFEPTSTKMLSQKHQTHNHFTIGSTTAIRPEQPRLIWASCIRTTDLAFLRFGPSIRTIDRVIRPKNLPIHPDSRQGVPYIIRGPPIARNNFIDQQERYRLNTSYDE